jgi:hypothetical protein
MAKKVEVVRTEKNYGMALSGKLGSRPDLEREYVRKFVVDDPSDGVTSLREAILAAYKDGNATPEEWDRIREVQAELAVVKEKLLAAGYTMGDLMKLTLDNSQTKEEPARRASPKPPRPSK